MSFIYIDLDLQQDHRKQHIVYSHSTWATFLTTKGASPSLLMRLLVTLHVKVELSIRCVALISK